MSKELQEKGEKIYQYTALISHKVDKEVTKVILLRLMNNQTGQDMLIQYLMSTKELQEKTILSKTKEIIEQTKNLI